ncbi:hypothetical protein So717_22830 [Roseobacter cerasinus]|uniref:Uncharacterized protein n=1 Tax=Roseobacter cerasinus TaxID=2602289 RepID=A0A640VSX6_9RHOB|nr:hypothetical protein So717_22830 [Roseobacter cerasinus]
MPLSTEDAVRETHRLALEGNLRKSLRTKDEFARFKEIAEEAAERIDAEKDAFRSTYHQRVIEATEAVLREHNQRTLNHPKPSWAIDEPPSADKIDLFARNRVQADHEARIAAIRVDQTHQYRKLRDACHARENAPTRTQDRNHGRARNAFQTANQISRHELGLPLRSGPSRS